MKLIQSWDQENPDLSQSFIELEENETILKSGFMASQIRGCGEIHIPEGIEEIETGTFAGKFYHTYYFPKSLKRLGDHLFADDYYTFKIKVVYPGSSQDFIALAAETSEEKYESDGFDHYPYYSGGSRWVTYYHCFDTKASDIEVLCMQDGVTLLYGTNKNRDEGQPPEVKSSAGE